MQSPKEPYVTALDEYVQLNRTFNELSPFTADSDSIDMERLFQVGKPLGWSDLLNEYRVILLSEAGSGKTEEIRSTARQLRAQGKPAFFLRLENIASNFEFAFEEGSHFEFDKWLSSDEEGWLLLDSVDEARLKSPADFALAIRAIGALISSAKNRTHIVITGRTSAWRPKTDYSLCVRHLPPPHQTILQTPSLTSSTDIQSFDVDTDSTKISTTENPQPFKIVTIAGLDTEQIEIFIRARGIEDTKSFLKAVERANASSFTTRPQDLIDLADLWRDKKRIGSQHEIMRYSVERRLTERDQTRDEAKPITYDRVRTGARLMAAATTLTKEPTFLIPDGANNTSGLSPRDVLKDWHEEDISKLLARPIFDGAIYGRVRFHHRSVREYLTAEWFSELLNRHTSRHLIESLFFKEQYGVNIITPTLRPILPWLSILDDKIRQRVFAHDPNLLLEGGDPSSLPLAIRKQILRNVCEQIGSGAELHSINTRDTVQRFANTDLSQEIRALLKTYELNSEASSFLLRMVWLGQIKDALPEALAHAADSTAEPHVRVAAFKAVKAIGTATDIFNIRELFASETTNLNREWLAELVADLPPGDRSVNWLISCIGKALPEESFKIDHLGDAVSDFLDSCDIALLPKLLLGFNSLLDTAPEFSRLTWLAKPSSKAVQRLIVARHPAALETHVLTIISKIGEVPYHKSHHLSQKDLEFGTQIPRWTELNRALFWFQIERKRQRISARNGARLVDYRRSGIMNPFWRFGTEDLEYVTGHIEENFTLDNRLVALSLALDIYRLADQPQAVLDRIKDLVANSHPDLQDMLQQHLEPPNHYDVEQRKWQQRSDTREAKRKKDLENARELLTKDLSKLFADNSANPGLFSQAFAYLLARVREAQKSNTRWADSNWQVLVPSFGEEIARFYRDGAVKFWRHYKPKLRSEGYPADQTANATIFGLVGIGIEAKETEEWLGTITEDDAVLACHYATFELNGFPTWFPELFSRYPSAVGDFLFREISYEIDTAKPDSDTYYVLSKVDWLCQFAQSEVVPRLYNRLQESEPNNLKHLDQLLHIVQGSSISDKEIAQLAAEKCDQNLPPCNSARWFAVWVGTAPDVAIARLAEKLKDIATSDEQLQFAMMFITHLIGGHRYREQKVRNAFQSGAHLKMLYFLMQTYIRSDEDIERAGGGVYSPGLRDDAQDARNTLYELLLKIPGKEGFLAIQEVANQSPDRPWLARYPLQMAERDGDLSPWRAEDVREFNDKLEKTPTTHCELAELVIHRLIDLKNELEEGDSSIAGLLKNVECETDMRKYIGKDLRDKAFGRYAAPQEEELADGKRTDFRVHGTATDDAPIPIELKLSDAWSGNAHFERLENQLCGSYLRDPRSTRGVFLLVNRGRQKSWILPNSKAVTFEGLVNALKEHWKHLAPQFKNIEDIAVIGIDLTKRGA